MQERTLRRKKQQSCVEFKKRQELERKLLHEIECLRNLESMENKKCLLRQQAHKVNVIKKKESEDNKYMKARKQEIQMIKSAKM